MRLVLATFCALLVLAVPAGAAVGTSAVTQPADLSAFTIERIGGEPGPGITVSGTSNGAPGDAIQIRCYERPDYYRALDETTVGPDGSWSTSLDGVNGFYPYAPCILRAADPLDGAIDFNTHTGPRIEVTRFERYTANGLITDAGVMSAGALAFNDLYSSGSCGPCDMALFDRDAWKRGNYLYYGNAFLPANAMSGFGDSGATSIRVDGHPAYAADSLGFPVPGREALGIDAFTSDRLDTTENIKRCTKEDVVPAGSVANCESAVGTGVQLVRTQRMDDGHRRATVTDTFRTTDGASHRLQLFYIHSQNLVVVNPGEHLEYQFPWLSDQFVDPVGDFVPAPPPGPATLLVRSNSGVPNGSFDFPIGATTFNPAPGGIQFANASDALFAAAYSGSVAPGRDLVIVQQMTLRDNLADAQAAGAANANALQGPTVTIASPAAGSTVGTPTVRATGIAVDNGGTPALKVNGVAVPVGADGVWTTDTPVAPGARTITAEATDGAGNVANTTTSFTVDLGADRTAPRATISGLGSSVRLRTFRRSGLRPRVRCNERCSLNGQLLGRLSSVTLRVDTGYGVLATRKLGLSASRRTVTLKPSSRFMRAVRRGRRLRLVIVATDAAGNARTTTRSVRIR